MNWYAGTIDDSLREFPPSAGSAGPFRRDLIWRKLEDQNYAPYNNSTNPWYTAGENAGGPWSYGAASAPWEGIGEGWYYSVLGGGVEYRPVSANPGRPVSFDNSFPGEGYDAAVPSVFNGNFELGTLHLGERFPFMANEVPGWSLHGGEFDGGIDNLIGFYPVGVPGNFAALMNADSERLVHNRQYIDPDAQLLKFDVWVRSESADDILRVYAGLVDLVQPVQIGEITLEDETGDYVTVL
jgi:hypothetical protein